MEDIDRTKSVLEQVVARVLQYPYGASRLDIALDFQIDKTTAKEHLEKAVDRQLLRKFYGWQNKRSRGWIYINPADSPNAFRSDAEDFNQQPADLIHDDRFRQLDNLQNALDHLDVVAELPDDELNEAVQHLAYDPRADDYIRY